MVMLRPCAFPDDETAEQQMRHNLLGCDLSHQIVGVMRSPLAFKSESVRDRAFQIGAIIGVDVCHGRRL